MPDAKTPRHIHTNRSAKADYLASMAFLCGGLYDAETICKVLVEEDLMDLVYESSFVKQLIQQGREQRERDYAIENIITVLEIRFDLHELEHPSARLATITDLQRLKQLHRTAIQVSSLEAFEQALDV